MTQSEIEKKKFYRLCRKFKLGKKNADDLYKYAVERSKRTDLKTLDELLKIFK